MLFDKLCGIIERHAPELRFLVESAHLFKFDGKPHEFLPKEINDYELMNNFFLPFRTVAIEDAASVVILHDPFPDMTGFKTDRIFLECLSGKVDTSNFSDVTNLSTILFNNENAYAICLGIIKLTEESSSQIKHIEGKISRVLYIDDKRNEITLDLDAEKINKVDTFLTQQCLRNPSTAIEEIMMLNTPKRFIVETKPKKNKNYTGKNKKILRSHERSLYTLLTVPEIRKVFTEKSRTKINFEQITGHERRRHIRTFKSDRFVNKKGQSVIIPATWVGPRQVETDKRIYEVRIDL